MGVSFASPPSQLLRVFCLLRKGVEIMEYLKLEGTFRSCSCPFKNVLSSPLLSYLTLLKRGFPDPWASPPRLFGSHKMTCLGFVFFQQFPGDFQLWQGVGMAAIESGLSRAYRSSLTAARVLNAPDPSPRLFPGTEQKSWEQIPCTWSGFSSLKRMCRVFLMSPKSS